MKVLHLTLSLAPGGRREVILMLARQLSRMGVASELGCLVELGCSSPEADAFPVAPTVFGRRSLLDRVTMQRLVRFCQERRADLIHAHDAASQFAAALVRLRVPRIKILMTFHRSLPMESATRKDRLRNACASALCGAIVTPSHERRTHFVESNVVNRAKVIVIPLGIDVQRFRPDQECRVALRRELGFEPEVTVLGVVGHFGPEKGVDIAVNGFRELCRRRNPASLALLVLGSGSAERTALLQELARRDPRVRVSFQGRRTDPERWFRAMDVFVHAPRLEAFGLVLVEAMASGLPVIAARVGGIPEIVRENRTGLLVAPESPELLAQALDNLVSDPARRAAMGEEGCRVAHLEYGSDLCAQRHRRLYEALLAGRPPQEAFPEAAAQGHVPATPR
jgi:glycosyltransferase involved in cell wall biosynthesis